MKSALLKLLLFLTTAITFAQNGSVEGRIACNKEAVAFASVYLENTQFGTSSDTTGYFKIDNIPAGSYNLIVYSMAHEQYKRVIEIKENEKLKISVPLNESILEMEEVVITGTMKEVTKNSSPIPVEVYSKEYFKKNPTPSLFESLQMVNGVQPQLNCNVCNTGDIHINGMEGPYTMITIDGMPIVSALSTVYGLNGIPNSLVQRIEVVKGPASTLYGSEAVGGLINVITKDPLIAPKYSFDVFATSQNEFNVDASYKKKIRKGTSLLGINYFNYQDKRDVNHDNFTDITLQNRISLFNKWSFERKYNRLATLALRYVYEDRWGGEMQWNKNFRGGDSIYGESIYTGRIELLGSYQLPISKEKILWQYSFNNHHQNSAYGIVSYVATQRVAFTQLLWDKKLGARHNLLIGVPLRYTYYDDNTTATQIGDSLNRKNKPDNTVLPGIFVQDEININDKLSSLPGLRYDYNSKHGSILSPRLSFKYIINKNNILRLSGGNGYRVVNLFTEDHAALTGARQVVISENLNPERSWNANLNIQKFIDHSFGFINLDASAFYTYFTNRIIGDFNTDPNKIIYSNLNGYAISKGFTLNSEFSFLIPLKIIAGATFMDVYSIRNEKYKEIKVQQLHAPKFSGTYAITYKINKLKLSIDYTGRVTGPMILPVVPNDFRPGMSPWFSIQNIQVTKKLGKAWEVYGGVKNILNFIPKDPLLRPFDPFDKNIAVNNPNGYTFDTTYNYAPIQGRRGFIGVRWTVQ